MKAIETRYLGPTNYRGSRIVASDCDHNRIVLSWDSALNHTENHKAAAMALASKMGWAGHWINGGFNDREVWVCDWEYSPSFTI